MEILIFLKYMEYATLITKDFLKACIYAKLLNLVIIIRKLATYNTFCNFSCYI